MSKFSINGSAFTATNAHAKPVNKNSKKKRETDGEREKGHQVRRGLGGEEQATVAGHQTGPRQRDASTAKLALTSILRNLKNLEIREILKSKKSKTKNVNTEKFGNLRTLRKLENFEI